MAEIDTTTTLPTETAPVAFKKRGAKAKSAVRKRPATPPPADSDEEEYSSEDEGGQRQVKRRRKNGVVTASSTAAQQRGPVDHTATKYAGDRTATISSTNDATKQSNWYDETDLSASSLLGTIRAKPSSSSTPSTDPSAAPNNGTYKGAANYTSFIQKNPDAPSHKTIGPVKAPTNIRTVTITDYAPDVCKDYKQTGFCGFGDSCKFLHAREDYASGWKLDKEWETAGKKKKGGTVVSAADKSKLDVASDEDEEEVAMLEKIPFACIICKEPYKSPVVTKCGHYFCEGCALGRYKRKPDCAACGADTRGVFNGAKMLKRLLEKKQKRADRLKAKEEGERVESGEEG
ncbi:RNA-splicing factor [Coniosporium uncinatum]|uniref:RNA-splicing factor n=1 Tax=Coniosporium uncinatum TaxID=93489 RepID=A0ACC3D759_9PEZI|nr:RNA-splicing factor [Coniosporium uncinatum]